MAGMVPTRLASTRGRASARRPSTKLLAEILEDRTVPSTGVPIVAAVPWRYDLAHEIYNGKAAILKGVIRDDQVPLQWTWTYGDGSGSVSGTITTANADKTYNVEASHVYPSSPNNTPYTATLTVTDPSGNVVSDDYHVIVKDKAIQVEANIAIDTSLWYLQKSMQRYNVSTAAGAVPAGSWNEYGYDISTTANAVLAYEVNGYTADGDPNNNPYAETVQRGLNHLLTRLTSQDLSSWGPGTQSPLGDPDTNGNNIGIGVNSSYPAYEIGPVMMALSASGSPNRIANVGPVFVYGRKFGEIVTDRVDMVSWGQADPSRGVYRGGWRYGWNYGDSDNSVSQWPMLGLEAAQSNWSIQAPSFVRSELESWINYSQSSNGGWGYQGPNQGTDNQAHLGASIAALSYLGKPESDARIQKGLTWLNNNWYNATWGTTLLNDRYAMYAVMKGMRIAEPDITFVGSHNWYDEFARRLVDTQHADGSWDKTSNWGLGPLMDGLWATLTLSPAVSSRPPVPVLNITPEQAQPGQIFTFDATGSYHLNSDLHIVQYSFDFGNGVTYTETAANAPDGAFDGKTTYQYPDKPEDFQPGEVREYSVVLTVTDDNPTGAQSASDRSSAVIMSLQNHPPVADPVLGNGDHYVAYVGMPLFISGADSYDPDQGAPLYNHIANYEWELDGQAPYNFNDATGPSASYTWYATGNYPIALRVTDKFGAQTTAWTYVEVRTGIPTQVYAQPDMEGEYSDTINLGASLKSQSGDPGGGDPIVGKSVNFYVDANLDGYFEPTEFVGTGETDVTGWAYVPFAAWLKPGFYPVKAEFVGEGDYFASDNEQGIVEVEKEATVVKYVGDSSGVNGLAATMKAVLTDNDGNPITGKNLSFTVATQSGSAVTNGIGVGTTTIVISQPAGTVTVDTAFAGDDYYEPATDSDPFQVTDQSQAVGLTVVIDDPSTPQVDVIIVDNAPIGTPTPLGPSTHADSISAKGGVSYFGALGAFPVVSVTAISTPLTSNTLMLHPLAVTGAAGGILDFWASDTGFQGVQGTNTVATPYGGVVYGKVTFSEKADPQNQPFPQGVQSATVVSSPQNGGFSGSGAIQFNLDQAQPFSLTKYVRFEEGRYSYAGLTVYGISNAQQSSSGAHALNVPVGHEDKRLIDVLFLSAGAGYSPSRAAFATPNSSHSVRAEVAGPHGALGDVFARDAGGGLSPRKAPEKDVHRIVSVNKENDGIDGLMTALAGSVNPPR